MIKRGRRVLSKNGEDGPSRMGRALGTAAVGADDFPSAPRISGEENNQGSSAKRDIWSHSSPPCGR